MKKSIPLIVLTAMLGLTATGAMAQNRWQGHDWDPPANNQWRDNDRHDNGRHNGWDNRNEGRNDRRDDRRRMVYAPRRGAAVREYVYYPQARAYYAPWNHRWYYRHGSRWVVQQNAPVSINLGNGINISLGAESPVTYDSYVVQHYREY
jgi:hypothetical protein